MRLIRFIQGLIKKMKWYDVSLLKLSVFFATLFLVAVWTGFRDIVLSIAWYWYLILTVVFAAPLVKRMLMD